MMARLFLILLVSLLIGASSEDAVPTSATSVAERWFTQLYGFDAFEAYEGRTGARTVQFVVARRWKDGRVQLLVDIRKPEALRKRDFLLFQNRNRSDDLFLFVPYSNRPVRRLTAAELRVSLPGMGWLLNVGDLRPPLPGELEHRPLADTEIEGEACWAVESHPTGRSLGFDRMELAISKKTGVALRTRYFRGAREVRRVLVSPEDVKLFDDRYLPTRRQLLRLTDDTTGELVLRNLMIDPPFPDQLFSKQSLITQRYPSF